ncbi:hypothetical protein [Nostoc sp.]|uniref:hypothetical protein n=1 Tax=Nostoc sp. TaxID=1180 RepID=UPI002FFB904C
MATKSYLLYITLDDSKYSGEADRTAEYYGNFSYHAEGESVWTTLVETNESAPWSVLDSDTGFVSANANKQLSILSARSIEIPASATFLEIKASIKEYDPSVFDADEDLGTSIITLPLNGYQQKHNKQGGSASGEVGWLVELTPKAR